MLLGLSTIMHTDKIVAMQDGRIVEVGTHTDLLTNWGLYYHLYKAQFEHAQSMPMPDEWGQEGETGQEEDADQEPQANASKERLALAAG